MKKPLKLTLMLFLFAILAQAQLSITTHQYEQASFNDDAMKWEINKTYDVKSHFQFDTELTKFNIVTGNNIEEFIIEDWDYNDDEVLYQMIVKDQKGNIFELEIDGINELVLFFYTNSQEIFSMYRYYITDVEFKE